VNEKLVIVVVVAVAAEVVAIRADAIDHEGNRTLELPRSTHIDVV
jgi:hypothetical protein